MVMSLPIKWIKKNNLKKGLELDVKENGNELTVSSIEREKKPSEIEIWIKDVRESAARTVIVNAYRIGYDKIIVHYPGNKNDLIEIANNHLLGFELFDKDKNIYTIENVSEPTYDKFEKIIKKMFVIILEILKDIENKELKYNVTRVQKYDNFLKRCISKGMIYVKAEPFYWQFLSNMAHIARECYHLNTYLQKTPLTGKEKNIIKEIVNMFNILQEGYLTKDIDILMELHEMEQRIVYDKRKELLKDDPVIGHYLISIARLIYVANSPLVGVLQLSNME